MAVGDVLIIGNGGREYSFARNLKKSPFVKRMYVAPGNAGTSYICQNVPIKPTDIMNLLRFACEREIDLTIVGPEISLALGVVDLFQRHRLSIFGPTQAASRIETSKVFAKDLMVEWGIPTASFCVFDSYEEAFRHVYQRDFPLVVKPDGLTGGKGAYVCREILEARIALRKIMINRIYGGAGDMVIIEDYLQGKEVSIHTLCNESTRCTLIPSRDHKTLKDGGEGPNTGGMGAYASASILQDSDLFHVEQMIINPILNALKARGTPFTGCLYTGLIITSDGPKVLEFNARFGNPETQSLMALLENNLFLVLKSFVRGESDEVLPVFKSGKHGVCVVLCSKEYPSSENNPVPIYGIEQAQSLSNDVFLSYGATKLVNSQIYTDGGRVLDVTGIGNNAEQAGDLAYQACKRITFKGKQNRTDIGKNILK